VGVYDWDPAFGNEGKVCDPASFEIVSQSDVIRFLHDRRDDEKLRDFMKIPLERATPPETSRGVLRCVLYTGPHTTASAW
jgi:hypothetical protein